MNWIAKIVFKIVSAKTSTVAQFDEKLTLIEAESLEEAILKSRMHGITEEAKSLAKADQCSKWEFVNVAELMAVPRFHHGAELYSSVHETCEEKNYINFVHHKAAALQLTIA